MGATSLLILLKLDLNRWFFSWCDLEIWRMTSKNNRAPLLYYIKLCAAFQIHRWILIGVTVRKRSIQVKIGNFFSRVTSKFDRWLWKIIGHLFYAMLSLVHHFKAICGLKLELQSGNAQFGSKSVIFLSSVTLKFGGGPSKTIGTSSILHQALCIISKPWVNSNWSYSPETPNLGQNRCFLSRVTLKFDGWPWKTIGHLFYATSSFVHHFLAISEFKLELLSGNSQFGSKSMICFSRVTLKFDGWPWKTTGHLS